MNKYESNSKTMMHIECANNVFFCLTHYFSLMRFLELKLVYVTPQF